MSWQAGIPEFNPQPGMDENFVNFLRTIREIAVEVRKSLLPPGTVTNFRVTPLSGANQIDFTRTDGDAYFLYMNTTPSLNLAVIVDLQLSNKYTDIIGAGSIKRWYMVKALKGRLEGGPSNWLSGTTLALNTPIVPPEPPPASEDTSLNQESDIPAVITGNSGIGTLPGGRSTL